MIARQSTDYFAVDDEVVAAALRFVSGCLAEKLSLERIAREVAVSPRTLQLRFSAALGRSISDEVRRLRLTTAQRMLTDPAWRIEDVAALTGYGTSVALNHAFQRELGISPKAYRKQLVGKRGT